VLKNSGHLFLWVDKYHLCNGVQSWLENTDLNLVDMIVWDKDKIGMGYRSRHKSEYLIVIQKSPVRAKGCWDDHSIPDVWTEKTEKVHPHSKPIELQKRLIEATTHKGDVVLDPASGGYSVYKACNELGIDFIGGDIRYGE
jgi:site-specific DNA-methyltransferase (adenine-specific)